MTNQTRRREDIFEGLPCAESECEGPTLFIWQPRFYQVVVLLDARHPSDIISKTGFRFRSPKALKLFDRAIGVFNSYGNFGKTRELSELTKRKALTFLRFRKS